MSSYSCREKRVVRYETYVPLPAVGADVAKALDSCISDYMEQFRIQTVGEVWDDAIEVRANGDELVFWFEREER